MVGLFLVLGAAQSADARSAATGVAATRAATPLAATPDQYYGGWVLMPAIAAIVLAILTRQVIPALFVGILAAAFMITPFRQEGAFEIFGYVVASVRQAVEGYLVGVFTNDANGADRVMVILFTLMIGGMVGVIDANGGTRAIVQRMTSWANTQRRCQFSAWFSGLLIFFDDYSNCMIIGPTMRPIFDRLRISRAKLAYIVDSTAAPVASILIGTWLTTEISLIDAGLTDAAGSAAGLPAFLDGATGFSVFWYSLPYRYYALLAIIMVALVALTQRDFGPMLKAERRALASPAEPEELAEANHRRGRAWYAVVPIVFVVGGTITLLFSSGWESGLAAYQAAIDAGHYRPGSAFADWIKKVIDILGKGNAYTSILYAGLAGLVSAVIITFATRSAAISHTFDGMLNGMTRVFPALVVLTLAWALSGSTGKDELRLAFVAEEYLKEAVDARWLPLFVFLASAVVSFATGTSWGTMAILCPLAVTLGAGMTGALPAERAHEAHDIFYATVGAVLVGSVFGDHCSPISDTTVLSALASQCRLEDHVWTQMPYALVTAAVSIFVGDFLCREFNWPWWVALTAGTGLLLLILMIFGRRSDRLPSPA